MRDQNSIQPAERGQRRVEHGGVAFPIARIHRKALNRSRAADAQIGGNRFQAFLPAADEK